MALEKNTPGAVAAASGGGIVGIAGATVSCTATGHIDASRFARAWLIAHYGVRPKVVATILEAAGLGGQ